MTYLEEKQFISDIKIELIEKLKYYQDCEVYASDLGYYLFQSENVDGSVLYSTYYTKEFIKQHFDLFGWLVDYVKENFCMDLNPFTTPEKAHVILCLEISRQFIDQLPYIQKNWDEEIVLDEKTIGILTDELFDLEIDYDDLLQ